MNDYQSLKNAVSEYTKRADLEPELDTFIGLAEDTINRELRVMAMEASFRTPLSGERYALPFDYLEMRNLYIPGEPRIKLRLYSPEVTMLALPYTSGGVPQFFRIVNREIRLTPIPAETETPTQELAIEYYAKFPRLTEEAPTNWLTDFAYELILSGVMLEAGAFMLDEKFTAYWSNRFSTALRRYNRNDRKARWSGATLEVRSPYSGV